MKVPAGIGLLVVACALGGAACFSYPDTSARLDDEIIGTRYDVEAKFSNYATFNVNPQIRVINGSDEPSYLDDNDAQELISVFTTNMKARGYVEVGNLASPDLGVQLTVVQRLNAQQVCFPYYYWGYGYYNPYYWGYPGYPYYSPYGCYTSAWKSGTLAIDIIDLKSAPPPSPVRDGGIFADAGLFEDAGASRPLRALWLGVVYGVVSSASAVNLQRATDGINQAFVQSPYLNSK